jgi:hypothetical protein
MRWIWLVPFWSAARRRLASRPVTRRGSFVLDPLLSKRQAESIVRLSERFGRYSMYSQERAEDHGQRGLPRQFDEVQQLLRADRGDDGNESAVELRARTDYFREEYAYRGRILIDGIEPFFWHPGFFEAARQIHGRPVVEPGSVVANIMVPGQEVALHTDVPEFRGMHRKLVPPWLLAAMAHSGLFERWRLPIATGVSWYQDCSGGAFRYFPDGPNSVPKVQAAAFNTALVLDTDTIFHGVERLESPSDQIAPLRPGMQVVHDGDGMWSVRGDRSSDEIVARYRWEELRLSVSWKGYCFQDEGERDLSRDHSDDLGLDFVLARLIDDLRARHRIDGDVPEPQDLAPIILDEYVRF